MKGIKEISRTTLLLFVLSALLSWLFYFKALQLGDVSKVAPIDKLSVVITIFLAVLLLGESASMKTVPGDLLITAESFILFLRQCLPGNSPAGQDRNR